MLLQQLTFKLGGVKNETSATAGVSHVAPVMASRSVSAPPLGRSVSSSPPGYLLLQVPPGSLKQINYIDLKASNDLRTVNVLEV